MYIENEIERVLDEMTTLVDWAIDTVRVGPSYDNVGDWETGGDDTCYDYIPNALDCIAWLAKAMREIHLNHVFEGDLKRFRDHNPLPCFYMDGISKEIGDRVVYLAIKLGYNRDELIVEGNWFDLEDGEITPEMFVEQFEAEHQR